MENYQEAPLELLRDEYAYYLQAKASTEIHLNDIKAEVIRRAQAKNDADPQGTNKLGDVFSVSPWEKLVLDEEAAADLYAQAEATDTLPMLPVKRVEKVEYKLDLKKFKAAEGLNAAVYAAVDKVVLPKQQNPSIKIIEVKA